MKLLTNSLVDVIEDCHTVYFDNFFTSYKLLCTQKEKDKSNWDSEWGNCPLVPEKRNSKARKGSTRISMWRKRIILQMER